MKIVVNKKDERIKLIIPDEWVADREIKLRPNSNEVFYKINFSGHYHTSALLSLKDWYIADYIENRNDGTYICDKAETK